MTEPATPEPVHTLDPAGRALLDQALLGLATPDALPLGVLCDEEGLPLARHTTGGLDPLQPSAWQRPDPAGTDAPVVVPLAGWLPAAEATAPAGSLVLVPAAGARPDDGRMADWRRAWTAVPGVTPIAVPLSAEQAGADPGALARAYSSGPLVTLATRAHPTGPGRAVLLSGLSGSGKSTIARALVDRLTADAGQPRVTLLDGDVVRTHLSRGLGFSRTDRDLNVRRIGWVAAEIVKHGGLAVCAPIAPYDATRRWVRDTVDAAGGPGSFVLVWVSTPIEVCETRDVKGLYAKARAGEIPEFTGVSDPYEEPVDADLVVDTSVTSLVDTVDAVLALLG